MGIQISALEIKNYRNFGDFRLDPFPNGAVIVGENGVGKSNLLDAIRLVLDPSLADSARRLRESDLFRGAYTDISEGPVVEVSVELSGFDSDADAKSVLSRCVVPGNPYRARITYRFAPSKAAYVGEGADEGSDQSPITIEDYDFHIFGGSDEDKDASRVKNDIGVKVLGALRDAESDLASWRRNPLRGLLENVPLDAQNLSATAKAMAEAADQLALDPAIPTLEATISERLENMAGSRLPVTPTLGFVSSAPEELVRAIRLFIDGQRRHSVGDASLGSANVLYLALLLELLSQQSEARNTVETLLAVEEPEAHLHVSLQRRLFRYLLRSDTSLLLTTHSPHIAAVSPVGSIVLLRDTPTGTRGTTSAGIPFTATETADIERYLDVTRAEILFASFVILVEGISEAYLVPAFAQACAFDLDGHGVVVANINGTDFAPYTRLLGPEGLDIPFVVITDGDAAPDKRNSVEAGLKRALRLADPDDSSDWKSKVAAIGAPGSAGYLREKHELHRIVRSKGIFVGAQTLETDVVKLIEPQMFVAFEEVSTNRPARDDVRAGLDNELTDSPDLSIREAYIKRISGVGKGRFSQRLASHVESLDIDQVAPFPDEFPAEDYGPALPDYGDADYIFFALETASQSVRGKGLREGKDNFGWLNRD